MRARGSCSTRYGRRNPGRVPARHPGILVQVPDRAQPKPAPPALPAMFGRVVEHVAALAQRGEVGGIVVAGIVVEMRAGQHNKGRAHRRQPARAANRDAPPPIGPPASRLAIPPAPVAQMRDPPAMRPCAPLASAPRAAEPDRAGKLRPVDRIKPAVFGADRHPDSMSQAIPEQKRNVRGTFADRAGRLFHPGRDITDGPGTRPASADRRPPRSRFTRPDRAAPRPRRSGRTTPGTGRSEPGLGAAASWPRCRGARPRASMANRTRDSA